MQPNTFRLAAILCMLFSCMTAGHASKISAAQQALHLDWRDLTYTPEKNFYLYANGTWIKNNPIPSDHASWSTFSVLQDDNINRLHIIMQAAATHKDAQQGSIRRKVGDFYTSGMDIEQRNLLGAQPLTEEFQHIEAILTLKDLPNELARLHLLGINAFFAFVSMQDFKDSTQSIGAIVQSGLTLPDRDYYLSNTQLFSHVRTEFIEHMQKMFSMLGESKEQSAADAQTVMRIETSIAQASMSKIAQRDPRAIYHIINIEQMSQKDFSWKKYLQSLKIQPIPLSVNVAMPEFIATWQHLLPQLSISEIKTYLRWHVIHDTAPYLSTKFMDESFRMSSILTGTTKQLPLWKQVVITENESLGFAIGKLYVKKYFSEKSKHDVMNIIHELQYVLKQDLSTLAWMTPATRQAALKKLDKMEVRVGYPESWWSYDSLNIGRGAYVLNVLRASEFLVKHDLRKINRPIDRSEWEMTPQTINAYYDPSMNSINLPSGILQAPFFDKNAPDAINFGGIGFVIGHEITHGFDDQGAKFDESGNLHNWWTASDLKTFKNATQCISQQFSKYKVNGNLNVQGPLVVGEATADLGGLTLAYRAYQRYQKHHPAQTIEGITPEQQFFLGAAHAWASNMRAQQAAQLITTDPHPPAIFRVNGTIANLAAFKKAFNLTEESSPILPRHICKIW